jgi:hypothetical protein
MFSLVGVATMSQCLVEYLTATGPQGTHREQWQHVQIFCMTAWLNFIDLLFIDFGVNTNAMGSCRCKAGLSKQKGYTESREKPIHMGLSEIRVPQNPVVNH